MVDLGYGASPVTALELHTRLARVRSDQQVVGIEIDPARVEAAKPLEREGVTFRRGGFEVPLDGGRQATVVRALNVLREYPEHDVDVAWDRVRARLTPDGLLVDGTRDEIGRRAAWVAVDRQRPVSLTVSMHLRGLERPSDVAERLPTSLIHRNVPGERVHDYLGDLDGTWARHAPASSWGLGSASWPSPPTSASAGHFSTARTGGASVS